MQSSLRHRLSPIAGIGTLAIGLGFVAVLQFFLTLLSEGPSASSEIDADAPVPLLRPLDSVTAPKGVLELSCYDPRILPIWHELKRDRYFQDGLAMFPGQHDCSELLKVKREDLNGDRQDEFFVSGKNTPLCGATGNCDLWVFGIRDGRMTQLLHSGGIAIARDKSKRHGFRNLIIRFNGSSYPDSLLEYRFNGSKFRLARCYQQDKQSLEKWEESCEGWKEDGEL